MAKVFREDTFTDTEHIAQLRNFVMAILICNLDGGATYDMSRYKIVLIKAEPFPVIPAFTAVSSRTG